MHWHAYSSVIAGSEISGGRQPECNPDNPSIFMMSEHTPDMVWWFLLRPRHHIKGTFHEVKDVTEWLAQQYEETIHRSRAQPTLITLEGHLSYAERTLPAGIDMVWTTWLIGARLATLAVVCCPNRFGDAPCPTSRQASQAPAHAGR